MGSVSAFPKYQLTNIPQALRLLAEKVETGELDARHMVVVIQGLDGSIDYKAFGDDFTKPHAVGLLELAKLQIYEVIEK